MRDFKRLIAGFAVSGAGVKSLSGSEGFQGTLPELASAVCAAGADQVLILDASLGDDEHEQVIGMIKETARQVDEPIFAGGRVKRLEDVKKYLYAGASAVFLDGDVPEQVDLIKEASDRFGPEKIYVRLPGPEWISKAPEYAGLGAWGIILTGCRGEDLSQDLIEDQESEKLRWILAGGCAVKDGERAAALLSGALLTLLNCAVYLGPFLATGVLRFRDCSLVSVWNAEFPWFDWTYGQYLLILLGLTSC